jgi:hypothetical protein
MFFPANRTRRGDGRQAVVGSALPTEPAGHDQHLVNDALMLPDNDGADLDLPGRFHARLDERTEQACSRRAQAAERLFLQLVADGPRHEVLREGRWRIRRERLPPATSQLLHVHLAYTCKRGVEGGLAGAVAG